jgi:hypothetical protein
VVRNRKVKNQRLAAAGYVWVFGALPSPQVKDLYDRRRAAGDRHAGAMRNVFNRLLGCLHHWADLRPRQGIPAPRIPSRTCRGLTVSKIGCVWIGREGLDVKKGVPSR